METPEKDLRIFSRIGSLVRKGELAEALYSEMLRYSVYDLQAISASVEHEIFDLPSPYREKVSPYFREQFFGRYHRIMTMHSSGAFERMDGPVSDQKRFREYCDMAGGYLPGTDESSGFSHFYYVISCFYMFVLEEPGHPEGTPFPGGFTVRKNGEECFCPIRDKEKDVIRSICNFCPAVQDRAPGL